MPVLADSGDHWDLRHRAHRDVQRHNQRIKDAIRRNLPEIVSQEDLITGEGKRTVRVPVRNLELPRFRFDPRDGDHTGQGDQGTQAPGGKGRTQPGTVLGRSPGPGQGKQAGDKPGEDYYEAEIEIDELLQILWDELHLPNLQDKGKRAMHVKALRCDTIRRVGPQANLDRRRTLVAAYRRNARERTPGWGIDPVQDPRYRSWDEVLVPERNAVVFAMRDVSGSMGEQESYICRSFYTWMVRFLRRVYQNVEVVFITCHTEAKEVDEEGFFHAGETGGTKMASAYRLCLDIIGQRYNPSAWNIYPFLFSDGEDWDADGCLAPVRELLAVSNLVGYGEITSYGYWGEHQYITDPNFWAPLGRLYHGQLGAEPRFVMASVRSTADVWPALKQFMGKRHEGLG